MSPILLLMLHNSLSLSGRDLIFAHPTRPKTPSGARRAPPSPFWWSDPSKCGNVSVRPLNRLPAPHDSQLRNLTSQGDGLFASIWCQISQRTTRLASFIIAAIGGMIIELSTPRRRQLLVSASRGVDNSKPLSGVIIRS